MADEAWLSDNEGRINNLSLAPNAKNTLFPLFEAVMNSIQAIEERFGRDNLADGDIEIEALKDERGDYVGFSVTDNGIGFNNDNILSFRKFDSRRKIKIGGKGVGRLLWLKVSDKATVSSHFFSEGAWRHVSFDFTVDSPVSGFIERLPVDERFRTEIVISPFKSEYATKIPKKLDTIANRLIAHFVSYFTNISHPKLVLRDSEAEIDLFDAFAEKVERDGDFNFELDGISESFLMHCFLLPKSMSDDEKSVNALYLGANGRAATRHELDSVLGMKAINDKFAFFGYVESKYLDANANDTRTAFSLEDDEITAIVDAAKGLAKDFLAPEIKVIRDKQAERIQKIGREHPRFFHEAKSAPEVAGTLHL